MVGEEQKNIRVIVRVRPPNSKELELNSRTLIKVVDDTNLLFDPDEDEDEFFFQGTRQNYRDITKRVHKKLHMEFDKVFDETSTNMNLFEECTKPLVASVMNGYNCSVFVYGATGAGKTFTMLGNERFPGITFLTMKELFDKINDLKVERKFEVGVSYLEVYNEQVMNLLTKMGPLKLREDSNGGVFVSGLPLMPIMNADDLFDMLQMGNKNRTQHPTDANSESSRSHAVFQVHIRMTDLKTKQKRTVKLSMIDLAGSERAASTKGIGVRFKEGASINKSLLALGNCINKLADGMKHIPYRDSNLTRILKDSLGGNCQTVMIANISPSSLTYEDTYNTLKYASRAKKIRTTIRQNILKTNMPKEYYVRKFCEQFNEIEQLKATIKKLEQQPNSQSVQINDENDFKQWCKRIDTIFKNLTQSQEDFFNNQSRQKIQTFRLHQKHRSDVNKRVLDVNLENLEEDIARIKTRTETLEKNINEKDGELTVYFKKHQSFQKELEKLEKEMAKTKQNKVLEIYIKQKRAQLSTSMHNCKMEHTKKINRLLTFEVENYRELCLHALDYTHRSYHVLNANKLMDSSFEETYAILYKLSSKYGSVQFEDDEEETHIHGLHYEDPRIRESSTISNGSRKRPLQAVSPNEENGSENSDKKNENNAENITIEERIKKMKIEVDKDFYNLDLNNFSFSNSESENEEYSPIGKMTKDSHIFKKPAPVSIIKPNNTPNNSEKMSKNMIRTTSGKENNSKKNPNSTFIASSTSTPLKDQQNIQMMKLPQKEFMNNVLSDNNVKLTTNRDLVKKVCVTKPLQMMKAVHMGLIKENKKNSPNRVQKSPRNASRALITSQPLFSSRQRSKSAPKSQCISDSNGPSASLVRINRAATLRAKK